MIHGLIFLAQADITTFALIISSSLNIGLWQALNRISKSKARKSRNKCTKCGYDLRMTVSGTCPECGEAFKTLPPSPAITHCNFCSRSNQATGPQMEGPDDVYICAE